MGGGEEVERENREIALSGASQFLELVEDLARSMPLICNLSNPDPKLRYPSHP